MFARLKIAPDGASEVQSEWPVGKGDEEWVFNVDHIVAWKGCKTVGQGGSCILKLSNGDTIKVEGGQEVLQILTGTHPSVIGNKIPN